ncbi:MAG: redoxin domain-containing protein [Gemmatimonadales bacterium]|nr:redoxin domain-containing protein [Gemmatimonadales bacterium]
MIARVVVALLLVGTASLPAQSEPEPLRLRLAVEDTPRVGRKAMPLVLPYATREGIGPADQPFDLSRELGRVVVLVFYPDNFTPSSTAEWQALRDRAATLLTPGVVVVGVSTDSLASHARFAQALDLPYKLLSDRDGAIIQRYGLSDGSRAKRAVVVIGRDGTIRSVDPAFAALDPQSYIHLAAAIRAAQEIR